MRERQGPPGKGDRFKTNIVSCAMFAAFLLEMPVKPTVDQASDDYREAMSTGAMKAFCHMGGRRRFTRMDIEGMKRTAALNAAGRIATAATGKGLHTHPKTMLSFEE